MVCQSETIQLLQEILNKVSPPQAETARYATRQPIGCQPSADVIPAPSAPLMDSALFVHPTPSAPSAGRKEPFQVFYEPLPSSEFNGNRSAGMTFWASCWSCIHYEPETFPDDATKIYWVMSHMTTGRASRWTARELDRKVRNGRFRFPNWSAFSEEFRRDFLPLHFEAIAVNALETTAYYQGKRSVGEYLDEFLNLVEDSRCTDLRTVVVKFRRGLDQRISTAPAGPSVVDPDAWFSFAIQREQDLASETTPSTPVPADEAIRTSAPSEEACCAPTAADLPTPTFATEILPPPIKEVPHLPAPANKPLAHPLLRKRHAALPLPPMQPIAAPFPQISQSPLHSHPLPLESWNLLRRPPIPAEQLDATQRAVPPAPMSAMWTKITLRLRWRTRLKTLHQPNPQSPEQFRQR